MRIFKYGFLLFFVLLINISNATVCAYSYFKEACVTTELCQNHYQTDIVQYRVKAYTIILNKYILKLRQQGLLKDKKFLIGLGDPIMSSGIWAYEGEKYYHIFYPDFKGIVTFMGIVTLFANPEFKGMEIVLNEKYDYYKGVVWLDDNLPKILDSTILNSEITVWEKDELKVNYMNEKLHFVLNNILLDMQVDICMPAQVNDRFILLSEGKVYAISNNGVFLSSTELPDDFEIDTSENIESYSKWVNIYSNDKKTAVSYSYEKNRFYVIDNPEK